MPWTRVDFVVDSGASATTLPRKVVGESSKKEPVGYRSFPLADGSVVANEGTLEDEVLELRASASISQPLLSVAKSPSEETR